MHFSQCILVNVVEDNRFAFCRQCYGETVKDDAEDTRASRGAGPGGCDTELAHIQFKRDKADSEGRTFVTLKGQQKTALGMACLAVYGKVDAEKLIDLRLNLSRGLGREAME